MSSSSPPPSVSPQTGKAWQPLVSVVMPAYQAADFITRAIDSIVAQTYTNWELWVVNDGSTDETSELLGRYPSEARIHVILQANAGTAAARNNGLSHCKGTYIAFLDADDIWLPTKLADDLHTFARHNYPVAGVYNWYSAVDEDLRLLHKSQPFTTQGHCFEDVLYNESLLLPSTTTLHRDIFEAVGNFAPNLFGEDREFFVRVGQKFPFYPTLKRAVLYQQTTEGKCRRSLSDFDHALNVELAIMQALEPLLSAEQAEQFRLVQLRNLAHRFLMYGYMGYARRVAKEVPKAILYAGKKGTMAKLSFLLNINLMMLARQVVQGVNRWLVTPFWRYDVPEHIRRQA